MIYAYVVDRWEYDRRAPWNDYIGYYVTTRSHNGNHSSVLVAAHPALLRRGLNNQASTYSSQWNISEPSGVATAQSNIHAVSTYFPGPNAESVLEGEEKNVLAPSHSTY